MKLRTQLSLGFGVLTFAIFFLGIFSLYEMSKINDASTKISKILLPSVVEVEEMNTLLSDFRIYEIQHAYTEDRAQLSSNADSMRQMYRQLEDKDRKYLSYPMREDEKRIYGEFKVLLEKYMQMNKEVIRLSEALETRKAIDLLFGDSLRVYNDMSEKLMLVVKANVEGASQADTAASDDYASARTIVSILLVCALLLAVGITVYIVRMTQRQLGKDPGELMGIAQRVTEGDYAIDDGSSKNGVYGNIVSMVDALKTHIENARRESERAGEESRKAREAMQVAEAAGREAQAKTESILRAADKLEEVAGIVSSASEELSAQIEQSGRGAAEQAARVTETATAMEEMNSTVLEVARNAGAASDVSSETRAKAEQGAVVVKKAVASIESVQQRSLALKEDMATLGEHARSINQIMGVISDIADQTNLLALNAAIEAARAGEAGRGFAVVADEVRKLAEKTMASTTDVSNAIAAIQQSADKNIGQVEETVKNIGEATDLAVQSGTALEEIVSMVDRTADQVRAIATASEQQSASSEEINQSISQVNTIAGETSRAMQEATQAVSDLAGQAQALGRLIDEMKRS